MYPVCFEPICCNLKCVGYQIRSWYSLVTAGVYLLIHFSPFSYWLNVILLLVSGLTLFIAGLGANFEFGLKRIALSTLRQ